MALEQSVKVSSFTELLKVDFHQRHWEHEKELIGPYDISEKESREDSVWKR